MTAAAFAATHRATLDQAIAASRRRGHLSAYPETPSGKICLAALHDSEVAARTVGIDVARHKLRAFLIAAVYGAVAGRLLAPLNGFVMPDAAGFLASIEYVTMVVIGGLASVPGAVVGAALLVLLPQAAAR
jgi:branched-chain amino acid transport system permease protein